MVGIDGAVVWGRPVGDQRDVVTIVAAVARTMPDEVAVRDGSVVLTYADLVARVEGCARRLVAAGVRGGSVVVVESPRSWAEVVAVLAVMRVGAAYTALDAEAPLARIREMLAACAPAAVVGDDARGREFSELGGCALLAVADAADDPVTPGTLPELPLKPESTAYVAFTSGSMGAPKGVVVPHRAVTRLVAGAEDFVPVRRGETYLRLAPLAFDASTFELFVPLAFGCTLEIFPPGPVAPLQLGSFLRRRGVTVAWLTAGLFRLVADETPDAFDGLTHLLTGGDVVPAHQVRSVLARRPGGLTVINGYGPTENTTFTTVHSVSDAEDVPDPFPIGTPIAGTGVLVVDEHLRPVDRGEVGELLVVGAGVAVGYLHEPALTAQAFVDDAEFSGRLYRTGDLVRWEESQLLFLGRVDRQVKVRGHRVELAGIESVLRDIPGVRDAAVAFGSADRGRGLVAFIVTDAGNDPQNVRAALRCRLPEYMVPSSLAVVDTLPLTANGKVDYDAMLRGADSAVGSRREAHDPMATVPVSANDFEAFVAAEWRKVLEHDDFGMDEGFFEVGGDSLAAAELHTRLCEALPGVQIRVIDIFSYPTVQALAEYLSTQTRRSRPRLA